MYVYRGRTAQPRATSSAPHAPLHSPSPLAVPCSSVCRPSTRAEQPLCSGLVQAQRSSTYRALQPHSKHTVLALLGPSAARQAGCSAARGAFAPRRGKHSDSNGRASSLRCRNTAGACTRIQGASQNAHNCADAACTLAWLAHLLSSNNAPLGASSPTKQRAPHRACATMSSISQLSEQELQSALVRAGVPKATVQAALKQAEAGAVQDICDAFLAVVMPRWCARL